MRYTIPTRIIIGTDGLPRTAPIETAEEALNAIALLRQTNGYAESHSELWLEHYLTMIETYIAEIQFGHGDNYGSLDQ